MELSRQAILRALAQRVIAEHQGSHRLNHRHSARKHARVVPAACGKFHLLSGNSYSLLRFGDRRGGFEGHTKDDGFTIADSSLNPA